MEDLVVGAISGLIFWLLYSLIFKNRNKKD